MVYELELKKHTESSLKKIFLVQKKFLAVLISVATSIAVMFGTPEALESNVTPLQAIYMMKQLVPQTQTIGIMWNQNKVNTGDLMPKIERASASVGVKVVIEDVEGITDVSQKFRDLTDNYHVQVIWVFQSDDVIGSSLGRDFLIKNSTVKGIALFAPNTDWVSAGACAALMNEGGTVKLFVNKKTITALGITVPEKFIQDTQFLATN
jgi:ABC-type uncharacterized transport system substrate-binding protein